jgi:hypothetical protein
MPLSSVPSSLSTNTAAFRFDSDSPTASQPSMPPPSDSSTICTLAERPTRMPSNGKYLTRLPQSPALLATLGLALALVSGASRANAVSNFCPFGTCVIADPQIINVYWETSAAQWALDIGASGDGTGAGSGTGFGTAAMTIDRIDTLVQSLVNSDYLWMLNQYNVNFYSTCMPDCQYYGQPCSVDCYFTTAIYFPSIVANCGSPPSSINDIANDKDGVLTRFINCVLAANPQINVSQTVMNLILPPSVGSASPTTDFCHGRLFGAEHDKFGQPLEITLIPANAECNLTLDDLVESISHEVIEGITDPIVNSPTGWKVSFLNSQPLGGDEIADECIDKTPRHSAPAIAQMAFKDNHFARFWSDQDAACVPANADAGGYYKMTPGPVLTMNVCGTGKNMILQMQGCGTGGLPNVPPGSCVSWAGLGNPPTWDMIPIWLNGISGGTLIGDDTGYIRLTVDQTVRHGGIWQAGGIRAFPADGVMLGPIAWTPGGQPTGWAKPDLIQIGSGAQSGAFSQGYGVLLASGTTEVVYPGDTVSVSVADQIWGQVQTVSVLAPDAQQLLAFSANPPSPPDDPYRAWIFSGDVGATVTGSLADRTGCGGLPAPIPVEGTSIRLSETQDTGDHINYTPPLLSDSNGYFSAPYSPGLAGTKTIQLDLLPLRLNFGSAAAPVHPLLRSITPTSGPVGGTVASQSQLASLAGYGFTNAGVSIPFGKDSTIPAGSPVATVVTYDPSTLGVDVPPSPLPAPGAGDAYLKLTDNGLDSEVVKYHYFVLGVPDIAWTPPYCNALATMAALCQDKNSNPVAQSLQITDLTGGLAFRSADGNACPNNAAWCSSIVVPSGTVVEIHTVGPFRISSLPGDPACNLSSWSLPPWFVSCIGAFPIVYRIVLPPTGPVDTQTFNSSIAANTVTWVRSDPTLARDFVAITAPNPQAIQSEVQVQAFSAPTVMGLVQSTPFGLLAVTGARTVELLGGTLSVTMGSSSTLPAAAQVGFTVPALSGGSYQILHLVSSSQGSSWQQVQLESSTGPVMASVTATGTYAIALVK